MEPLNLLLLLFDVSSDMLQVFSQLAFVLARDSVLDSDYKLNYSPPLCI